jgi:hypothetical protein
LEQVQIKRPLITDIALALAVVAGMVVAVVRNQTLQ